MSWSDVVALALFLGGGVCLGLSVREIRKMRAKGESDG